MASISTDKSGNRRILFTNRDGQRKAVYLGSMPKKQAETVCTKIEALNAAKVAGVAPADEVSRWTAGIGDDLHAKLLSMGLVDPRNRPTEPLKASLESFIERFIQGGGDKSPRTLIHYRQCRGLLMEHFGADKALVDITKHDAKLFVSWLRGTKKTVSGNPFAENTVRGHVETAKTIFNTMVDAELRPDSPFKGISHQQLKRKDRMVFLDRETIRRVLESCPDARWRAIVVLCRFGGLRCPSELLELRWADIDFERSRMRVRSPKGEKFGKGLREIPLFEEVRTVLEELFMEPGGAEHVISANDRSGDKNLRTTFEKIIRRAGLKPWESLRFRRTRQQLKNHLFCSVV